jgi:hypothetical protein
VLAAFGRFRGTDVAPWAVAIILLGVLLQFQGERIKDLFNRLFARESFVLDTAILTLALLVIIQLGPSGVPPFIYFKF